MANPRTRSSRAKQDFEKACTIMIDADLIPGPEYLDRFPEDWREDVPFFVSVVHAKERMIDLFSEFLIGDICRDKLAHEANQILVTFEKAETPTERRALRILQGVCTNLCCGIAELEGVLEPNHMTRNIRSHHPK